MASSKILIGMRQAVAYARGEAVGVRETTVKTPASVDVKAIREGLGLSQSEFARQFGFSTSSIRNWEQGHRYPEGPARVLLKVIEIDPEVVRKALSA
ncbi:helix-turn-helix domain-containing protein [Rhodospirillum rubrum]|uniref:Transcriptional regulator, XRE family n=1 Tax=Rhodospirillum rubrum (strain ATCC 11170 / ATH 1.1.1 / DSM 467 / LMG 4362 / NCIMB 8255 / S1) TaxID=269796 RepID=Q2RXN6_RHORT|nr:helix-turn-helix domain-containing protein [Rhodospirillum rubrum]ABC21109.1 transcriptional regulator, XRE family [Rhodospirillum rubrum ATCC 11170]AEO46777.1 XRE family transcriptional regulator [Rhodospirillum rubrum F11]MBK5952656.1 transcriptional regulator [Rhodospirillum rubrum]QXG80801.1 helix-turn-helix domain-containing protein [Rhodospirillum rubrum]HAQ00271.1 transcriptional regulator [Rhodospirillum rubrum]